MPSLEEAKERAAELFAAEEQSTIPATEGEVTQQTTENVVPAEEVQAEVLQDTVPMESTVQETAPQEGTIATPAAMTEQAISAAESATQVAQQKDRELEQAKATIAQLSKQQEEMRNMIDQMSQKQAEAITETMVAPTLDTDKLMYADAATQAQMMADYQSQLTDYNRAKLRDEMMKEFEPAMQYARAGLAAREREDALRAISEEVPELGDIKSKAAELDGIIGKHKFLSDSDMPMEEKYIVAEMISRGIDTFNNPPAPPEPPKAPTAQELMEYAKNNPEFASLLEQQRIASVQNGQQVPPFSASSGAVNAAPNIPNKPTNLSEAREQFKKMFRV